MAKAQVDPKTLQALGPRLAHVTARSNVPSILEHGMLSAHDLAARAGDNPENLLLRRERMRAGEALLNHQLPISQYLDTAEKLLDGITPKGWSALLDTRIFFWNPKKFAAFQGSIERNVDASTLWFDTEKLLTTMADHVTFSPLNSGSFRQGGGGVKRGPWLFVPLKDGYDAFRRNRVGRGLVKTFDSTIREVSITAPIPPETVQNALLEIH